MSDSEAEHKARKERIADLYHRVASVYGQVGPNYFAYAGRHLVEHTGVTESAQVLDVATGRGANLFAAAEVVGPQGMAMGVDLALGMVRETAVEIERRKLSQAAIRQMDAEHLVFSDASFDYVLCGFAIFFFPHLERALAEFLRVLRPGGRLGITVAQDLASFSRWYGEHLTAYHQRYHIPLGVGVGKGGDYAALPEYLTLAGFVGVQVIQEQAEFIYADAQEWWDSRWTHGPRYSLEQMTPQVLAQFKAEVLARLSQDARPDGIHETMRFQYIIAGKKG
ncbi:methyltransferase [Reticulibacter mediterranei]|uniref:Methyltransferase n=1 Tax=Reticulibacter mediterranei TaxID=2778369 RepID=A0A8J3IGQ6_9CHLR|nr:methyltransferase domain-containing protein [Reticulibacter mediterranei]GHO92233.1 methyltransferase [Reticulibacter mediterranei]